MSTPAIITGSTTNPPVPTPPPAASTAPQTEASGAKPADEALGAPGLAALKAERDARSAAEKATADALAKLKELEDRDKTEAQKTQEALEKAQRDLADLTLAKTRAEVAAAKGVPPQLLTGSTQADLEASADALIQFRDTATAPRTPQPDPNQGGQGGDATNLGQQFAGFLTTQLGG